MIYTAYRNAGIFEWLRSMDIEAVDIIDLETPGIVDWVLAAGTDELRLS